MRRHLLPLLLAPLAPLAACTEAPPDDAPVPGVTTGAYHHYVQTGWDLPTSGVEARAQGFDLERDGSVDNQVGMLVSTLGTLGLETGAANAAAFESGALVVLHSVRADSLADDDAVTWRQLDGLAEAAPRFDGTDTFHPTSDAGLLTGAIARGVLSAGGGDLDLRVPFFADQPAIVFPLRDVRLELRPADGTGRIGGGIDVAVFEGQVLPAFADQALLHMARHPGHEFTTAAVGVFDRDDDGRVSRDELIEVVRSIVTHDLDLDGDGDGDAISMGLGFGIVGARFEGVGE